MANQIPAFDAAAVGDEVRSQLGAHRNVVAPTIAAPATSPMFTREQNGALVDRAGNVVIPAPTQKS